MKLKRNWGLVFSIACFFAPQVQCQEASQTEQIKQVYDAEHPWEHLYKYGDIIQPKSPVSEANNQIPLGFERINDSKNSHSENTSDYERISKALSESFTRFAPKQITKQKDSSSGLLMIQSGIPKKVKIQQPCVADEATATLRLSFRNLRLSPTFNADLSWTFKLDGGPAFTFRPCSIEELKELNDECAKVRSRNSHDRADYSTLETKPASAGSPPRF